MGYLIIMLVIGFLILWHEFGHLLAAKKLGIPVAKFSIGFGPAIWSCNYQETIYKVSLIPLGGYVMPAVNSEEEFFRIPVKKRILFTLGGPIANIVLVVICLALLNWMTAGFSLNNILVQPFIQTVAIFSEMIMALPKLFSQHGQLSGIIGIVVEGGQAIGLNAIQALSFVTILSLNLAVFNLLPIPALDGGKVLLYLLEVINPKFLKLHAPLAMIGWVLILGLLVYVTILDVGRYMAAWILVVGS